MLKLNSKIRFDKGMKYGLVLPIFICRAMSTSLSVLFVTTNSMENATGLARGLVENQLVACVNIIPGVTSIYKWEGQMNQDSELILMLKTRTELVEQVTNWVKSNHPYTCPEVIALPIIGGNQGYLDFMVNSTKCG
jgi:periplasmic divalent cation tolerance protein